MLAIEMVAASLRAVNGAVIVGPVDWAVGPSERWVVLGANGCGKTSLLRLASAQTRPTSGTVHVLGRRLGATDLRALRPLIGVTSASVDRMLRPGLSAVDAVMTARFGALEPWWHEYSADDRSRAVDLLQFMGCGELADRPLESLSQGERQRVLLARLLMPEPRLLLFDEPAAGLDLPARESLVDRLAALAVDRTRAPLILVTHHVEEIPPGMTHALLLRRGQAVARGPIEEALTAATLSDALGMRISLQRWDDRWTARAQA